VFFGHAVQESLASGLIDYLVHGEGERALLELLNTLADGGDMGKVTGISYRPNGGIVTTPARPLVDDMDTLPMPAWSKVAMRGYGLGSKNHAGLVAIEHSRGCIDACDFCILWKHMGTVSQDGKAVKPCYRTKSAERSFEEVSRLIRDFDRYTFGWVDPTWNADPSWTDRFSGLLLRHGIKIQQTAWMRADGIVRDEELGILDKAVARDLPGDDRRGAAG
jgi:anaerobic magnesium-protoporphyrin IX monomethyl ester cyclase